MPAPGLLAASLAALAAGLTFLAVGNRLGARRVEGRAAVAWALFRGWWYGIGTYALLAGFALNGLAAFGLTPLKLFVAARSLALLVLCLALCALTFYLLFVFRGRLRDLPWVVGFYGFAYAFVAFVLAGHRAVGVSVGAYETRIRFDPLPDPALFLAAVGLLTVPQFVTALAHVALARRVVDRSARYRALMVGGSLALWFASSLVADLGVPDSPFTLLRPAFGLLAAWTVLAAYAPPGWMRRRFGVDGLRATS